MTRRVQACLQMQGGHFFASFVKVIKTENSLHLMNKDRQDVYLYDFFSLFLGVQSAPEVGATSYETPSLYLVSRVSDFAQERIARGADVSSFGCRDAIELNRNR